MSKKLTEKDFLIKSKENTTETFAKTEDLS